MKKLQLLMLVLAVSTATIRAQVGTTFTDEESNLKFKITAVGEENTVEVGVNSNYSGDVIIPKEVIYNGSKYTVPRIGEKAFGSYTENRVTTSVSIPETVTSIGANSFLNCKALTSVSISKYVRYIETDAFAYCSNMTEVNVEDMDAWVQIDFANGRANPVCNSEKIYSNGQLVTDVVLTDVPEIGSYAFYYCTSIKSISVPSTVKEIGKQAFYSCTGLSNLYIEDFDSWAKLNLKTKNHTLLSIEKMVKYTVRVMS